MACLHVAWLRVTRIGLVGSSSVRARSAHPVVSRGPHTVWFARCVSAAEQRAQCSQETGTACLHVAGLHVTRIGSV